MNRSLRWKSLVVLGLLAMSLSACASSHTPKPPKGKRGASPAPEASRDHAPILEADGYGDTTDDAYERALKTAQTRVQVYLAEHEPSMEWSPSSNDIKPLVLKRTDNEQKDEKLGRLQHVHLRVQITDNNLAYMRGLDRQQRAEWRMLWLGKLLAGIVALLTAVAGYTRLEEATKGYYTTWLRLGALGFVSAVVAVVCWIW
jgi:hypothetical protein